MLVESQGQRCGVPGARTEVTRPASGASVCAGAQRYRMPSRREPQLALTEPFGCGEAAVGVAGGPAAGGLGLGEHLAHVIICI